MATEEANNLQTYPDQHSGTFVGGWPWNKIELHVPVLYMFVHLQRSSLLCYFTRVLPVPVFALLQGPDEALMMNLSLSTLNNCQDTQVVQLVSFEAANPSFIITTLIPFTNVIMIDSIITHRWPHSRNRYQPLKN